MTKFKLYYLFAFCFLVTGCRTALHSRGRTQYLNAGIELPSVNVVSPNVFSAFVGMETMARIDDSLFDASISKYTNDSVIRQRYTSQCYRNYYRFFRNILSYYLPPYNADDSLIVARELKTMEWEVHNNDPANIKVPDSLLVLLSKYPGNQFLLTDIKEYHNKHGHGKTVYISNYLLIQCFLVDVKLKSVTFYNYKIWKNTGNGFLYSPGCQKVLHKLKKDFPGNLARRRRWSKKK